MILLHTPFSFNLYSMKNDDYLNKLLYLMTGSESLPINGWESFKEHEFKILFTDSVRAVNSHTCNDFKRVDIPIGVLQGTVEEIKPKLDFVLSYSSVVASGRSSYCQAGGGFPNNIRNFI